MVRSCRLKNASVPVVVDDIVMRALAGEVSSRYQRAEDFLGELLNVRRSMLRKPASVSAAAASRVEQPETSAVTSGSAQPVPVPIAPRRVMQRQTPARIRTRDVSTGRFCWHCRKPLPARASRCPFCDETQ
jgi:hypothetical protein